MVSADVEPAGGIVREVGAGELLAATNRKLDKAATKGGIHKKQAANKKSALTLAFDKL